MADSAEELFGLDKDQEKKEEKSTAPVEPKKSTDPAAPETVTLTEKQPKPEPEVTEDWRRHFYGFFQSELAYTYANPEHWSKFRNIFELGAKGALLPNMKWRISGRVFYDPIYDMTNFYFRDVRADQRQEWMFRETYLDASFGDWDFRIGRQHIIWGEMVGLFFADVVSAKDLRQFVLPDFDLMRIPQWAVRTEYFKNDFHAEAIWIPYMTYDNIGKVGSDYFPFRPPDFPGFRTVVRNDDRPPTRLEDSAYGARLSYLHSGWDTSVFYYSGLDQSPAFSRAINVVSTTPTFTYSTVHKRVHQWGVTFAKDISDELILKGEFVYTKDRLFNTERLLDNDGLVKQDFLDYVLGLNFNFADDTRVNAQFFQRWYTNHQDGSVPSRFENGYSLLLSTRALHPHVEPEVLYVQSLNRFDWMLQLKTTWEFAPNWRAVGGFDIFGGPPYAAFGRFDQTDRVYTEIRYSF